MGYHGTAVLILEVVQASAAIWCCAAAVLRTPYLAVNDLHGQVKLLDHAQGDGTTARLQEESSSNSSRQLNREGWYQWPFERLKWPQMFGPNSLHAEITQTRLLHCSQALHCTITSQRTIGKVLHGNMHAIACCCQLLQRVLQQVCHYHTLQGS
jgi:hypothetical protein